MTEKRYKSRSYQHRFFGIMYESHKITHSAEYVGSPQSTVTLTAYDRESTFLSVSDNRSFGDFVGRETCTLLPVRVTYPDATMFLHAHYKVGDCQTWIIALVKSKTKNRRDSTPNNIDPEP